MRRAAGFACLFLTVLAAGCGARYQDSASAARTEAAGEAATADSPSVFAAGEAENKTADARFAKPRIIYTATVGVVVKDFAPAEQTLLGLVKEAGGYVATASLNRSSGDSRYGRWSFRVPVAEFESFLAALDAVGYVESRSQSSQDVTMEYVDTESRIANLKRLEEQILKLLNERAGELDDLLKIEQELARVRGEIEQAEGRLRYLTNKTDFTTVDVTVREERDYVPPKAPTFGDRVATTWGGSLDALKDAAEAAALVAVALAPWLAVAAVPLLGIALTLRLALRRRASTR